LRDDEEETHRGWWANLEYQTGGDRLKGDHAFDRFTAEVRRFQPLTYRQNVNARIKYGTSGRDLPMFREFYLGGMRTIRGLDHKSLRGEQMFLANIEYALYFPRQSFETALLFDIGAVGNRNDHLFSDGDFHSSIGFRVGLEEGLSIEVAKSLDESEDSLKLWVLFQRSF
jgi:hemolysin activation/secretion protein